VQRQETLLVSSTTQSAHFLAFEDCSDQVRIEIQRFVASLRQFTNDVRKIQNVLQTTIVLITSVIKLECVSLPVLKHTLTT
jgi:hypothetical protein